MDPEITEFARSYQAFQEAMARAAGSGERALTPVGEQVQEFLGVPLGEVEPITESFLPHQTIDVDLALQALLAEYGGTRLGIGGSHRAQVDSFEDFLTADFGSFAIGPVQFERKSTGPDSDRRVVALGLGEVWIDGVPLVWLQRTPLPRYGRDRYTLEVLCPDAPTADGFLSAVRERMAQLSVLRGQVISFVTDNFDYHGAGSELTFLRRPQLRADEVILPDGTLERVARHVVGIGEQRAALRAAGQHLKRGVLLYGPPVEIGNPDLDSRERLFRLYAAEMLAAGKLTEAAVHTAAARTEGVTASFTKELIRRVAINAAQQERPPRDADVSDALDEMMSDAESLTRTLLGGEGSALAAASGYEAEVGPGVAPALFR